MYSVITPDTRIGQMRTDGRVEFLPGSPLADATFLITVATSSTWSFAIGQ